MIFTTERLIVRKLTFEDLEPFHKLESDPLVLQYASGEPQNFEENKNSLKNLIDKYDSIANDFWIYAIERRLDNEFVGTVALVKDGKDDEIGYRLLQKYWGNAYGSEVCSGLIQYAKQLGLPKLIGYVVDVNIASAKILEQNGFKAVNKFFSEDVKLPETKYELIL